MILVSACLAGFRCSYNGENKKISQVIKLVKMGKAIPVCPEQLGGLSTPRISSECKKVNDKIKVITKDGKNVTIEFYKGAREVLAIARIYNCEQAIMRQKSPSCGTITYDGTFTNTLGEIRGITADLLIESGINVIPSNETDKINELIKKL